MATISPRLIPLDQRMADRTTGVVPVTTWQTNRAHVFDRSQYPPAEKFVNEFRRPLVSGTGDGGANLIDVAKKFGEIILVGLGLAALVVMAAAVESGRRQRAIVRDPEISTRLRKPGPHGEAVRRIKARTQLPDERLARLLGVSRQTLNKWSRGEPINDRNRRKLLVVLDILERASIRLKTPGDLVRWLDTPRGMDGQTPAQLLEAGKFDRARLLAVSVQSPGLKQISEWVGQPTPERFKHLRESRPIAEPPDDDAELAALIAAEGSGDEEITE